MGIYGYSDIVQSNVFEGLGYGYDYTIDELNQMNQTVLATLVLPMADPALVRNMYVSKQLRLPLSMMSKIVDSSGEKSPMVKFLSYSTHDWTVAQSLLFFAADNGLFEVLPFASNIIIELHSTDECKSEDCFWVEVIYNGKVLEFADDCASPGQCTFPEFMFLLQMKGFVNTSTHYEKECAKQWSPPTAKKNSIENFLARSFSSPMYNAYFEKAEYSKP